MIVVAVIAVVIFGVREMYVVDKAHQTFENYYAFRGCVKLLNRTPDYGICQTDSGQTIKIVKFHNKWYLDGDLPICWRNICL
jgi:hypothetical protein